MKIKIEANLKNEDVQFLWKADKVMGKLIQIIGNIEIQIKGNRYESLVKSIIGQQLSVKAAGTIIGRVEALCNGITPQSIDNASIDELRATGISRSKINYMKDLTEKFLSNQLKLDQLDRFSNDEVITELTKVKGIGQWTAEMFLIFSLVRNDVLSLGDVGLQRACKWLYQADKETNGKDFLEQKAEKWKPYYSIASLYLWEAVNRDYVIKYKTIDDLFSEKEIHMEEA
ncbi:DNA-3-methyladenine glycosylase family protein [Neobacillus vireti]|uniref:DNA-3-methyladenine glycosylase family protein n=1 Tax=Neobacillus vireti TaxID=220686 RepID=UPI002FFD8AAD